MHFKISYLKTVQSLLSFLFVAQVAVEASAESLSALIAEAASSHPAVQSRLAQTESAELQVDLAKWQYYPTPAYTVSSSGYRSGNLRQQGDDEVATLSLNQPLWTAGRIRAGIDIAEAGILESYAGLEDARQTLALRTVQAYSEWLAANLKYKAQQVSLEEHDGFLELVTRRVNEGASPDSDLALARGRLESTKADLATVLAQQQIALSRLEQLIGRALTEASLENEQSDIYPILMDLDQLQGGAEDINPGLNRALAQVEIAGAEIKQSKADLWPEISLRVEHQRGDFNFPNFGTDNRVLLNITSRFGAGLSSTRRVDGARLRQQAALAEVESQRRSVAEQVITDYVLLMSFESRLSALNSSVEIATDVSEAYERQFLAGRKTWLDVMNAARDLVNTRLQLADAEASQLAVTWRLAIISQGLDGIVNLK